MRADELTAGARADCAGGKNWERVPLSAKLPGNPMSIFALEGKAGQAELTTDQVSLRPSQLDLLLPVIVPMH